MFSSAHSVVITDGTFAYKNPDDVVGVVKGIDRLKYNVAASAFHDSSERLDPPKCHPSTRRALLDEILNWILEDAARETWLMWLHGAAGSGKSAIFQSIAEACITKGIIVTSFFFHHADPTRNSFASVVATLAYQLAVLIPEMHKLVVQVIEANPRIFAQSLSTQFEQLIIRPLQQQLSESSPRWKMLFLLDGLNECDKPEDQTQIVHVFGKFLKEKNLPIVVLFSSRPEPHLRSAFNSPDIAPNLLKMPLDNHYLPDQDIRLLLNDAFGQIKSKHPLAYNLAPDWPPPDVVQEIVDKSSGQFIYASVVLKFISSLRHHPAQQLDMILGLRPSGRSTPFAELDALYHHIFSKVQDLARTLQLLAYAILGATSDINHMAAFFDVSKDDIYSAMADLSSVISCQDDGLHFLHFSLPDFLLDRARSGQYYIDPAKQSTDLSILGLRRLASKIEIDEGAFLNILSTAAGSPQLHESVLGYEPSDVPSPSPTFCKGYLSAIKKIDFGDEQEAYRRQLDVIIRYATGTNPDILSELKEAHDIPETLVEAVPRMQEEQLSSEPEKPKKLLSRRSRLKAWLSKRFKVV